MKITPVELLIAFFIGFILMLYFYVLAKYGSTPVTEVPFYVYWLLGK